jgi:dUTP pyrophosphatase
MDVTRLVENAQLPEANSVGYDLFSLNEYVIHPGRRVVVSTGIAVTLPPGTYGRIAARTGLAVKHGLTVLADVIDPDYKDEIKIVLHNTDLNQQFVIRPGYRIAQLIVSPYLKV